MAGTLCPTTTLFSTAWAMIMERELGCAGAAAVVCCFVCPVVLQPSTALRAAPTSSQQLPCPSAAG